MVLKIRILLLAAVLSVFALLANARLATAIASLYMEQGCAADGTVTLSFSWQDGNPAAKQRWIDVSTLDNSWQAKTYVSAGPISLDAKGFSWPGYRSGTHFYLRFNEQRGDGSWDPSSTYDFVVRQCTSAGATVLASPLPDATAKPAVVSGGPGQPTTQLSQPSAPISAAAPPQSIMTYAPKAAATAGEPGSRTSIPSANSSR